MDIALVHIFISVVKAGSFTKAAANLGLPKSTVSKAISQLEEITKTKILLRTTRSLSLTEAGRKFYDSCVGPLQAIEEAQRTLVGKDHLLNGNLKITAPEDLGTEVIAPAVGRLVQEYPGLSFELVYTDEVVDLIGGGYDLAIRIGYLKESSLKFKKLGEIKLILVTSSQYLKTMDKIQRPEQLQKYSCLSINPKPIREYWSLKSKSSQIKLKIQPRILCNQMSSLLKATLAGGGIALMPEFFCRREIESGNLVQILPQWSSVGMPVSVVSPLPFSASARLRLITDQISEVVQNALT